MPKQIHTAVWIHLPNLPTEFYNGIILQTIRNSIGRLLKIDACTSATLRGRYARLCVELPMDKLVVSLLILKIINSQLNMKGRKYFVRIVDC